jgi:AcrR family transcriptional regulator
MYSLLMKRSRDQHNPPTQPRGDAFIQRVLEVALTQLAEVGYERLSIPQVAQLAGVNKTSIYRRWPTKPGLVRDALSAAMIHVEQAPNAGSLRADLIELALTVATFTQSPVGTAIVRIMLAEGGNAEVRGLASSAYAEAGKNSPWVVLERAVSRGELRSAIDPSLLLFTIAGAIMHRVFVERRDVPRAFIEQLIDLLLNGCSN